jgi:DNA-binding transcriptional regulator WhiA
MARVTIYLRNGREVDFDTASIKVTTNATNDTITKLEYFKKDNGMSLLFVDPREIVAITRDTTKNGDDS